MSLKIFNSGALKVSGLHTLSYDEYGNPNGTPLVWLHGGPGAGCNTQGILESMPHDNIRLILFDQRGAGISTPYAETEENNTPNLIEDIEKLRQHLKIDAWHVGGGSWGSLLALLYMHKHPQSIKSLMLRGLFLGDAAHLLQPKALYAEHPFYTNFVQFKAEGCKGSLIDRYNALLNCGNQAIELQATKHFMLWDTLIADSNIPDEVFEEIHMFPYGELACARLFFHYAQNGFFIKDILGVNACGPELLKHIHFSGIPIGIFHGQDDLICDVKNAYALSDLIKNKALCQTPAGCGHSSTNPKMMEAQKSLLQQLLID